MDADLIDQRGRFILGNFSVGIAVKVFVAQFGFVGKPRKCGHECGPENQGKNKFRIEKTLHASNCSAKSAPHIVLTTKFASLKPLKFHKK